MRATARLWQVGLCVAPCVLFLLLLLLCPPLLLPPPAPPSVLANLVRLELGSKNMAGHWRCLSLVGTRGLRFRPPRPLSSCSVSCRLSLRGGSRSLDACQVVSISTMCALRFWARHWLLTRHYHRSLFASKKKLSTIRALCPPLLPDAPACLLLLLLLHLTLQTTFFLSRAAHQILLSQFPLLFISGSLVLCSRFSELFLVAADSTGSYLMTD